MTYSGIDVFPTPWEAMRSHPADHASNLHLQEESQMLRRILDRQRRLPGRLKNRLGARLPKITSVQGASYLAVRKFRSLPTARGISATVVLPKPKMKPECRALPV